MGRDIAVGDGLYRVVQKSGIESWAVRYRSPLDKRQVKVTLGRCTVVSQKEARKRARELLGQVARDVDPMAARRDAQGELWEAVVVRYLQHSREHNRPSTSYTARCVLMGSDVSGWKGRRVGTIKWRDILVVLEGIKARGATVQTNRVFSLLSRVFNFAVEHELLASNPCERKRKPSKESARDRVLSDEELRRIWLSSSEYPYGPLVRMLMLTGQRREEVAGSVWDEFQDDVWHLPGKRTKNGRPHCVPLSSQVVELVASLPRVSERLFIHSSGGFLSRHKLMLDAACGVEDWVLHDLRRTMCSGMARLGVPIHVIEKCINHISGTLSGVAGIYNRYSYEKEKREALQKWGDHISGLMLG